MRILFYGNCQTFVLQQVLNIQLPHITRNIECFSTNISHKEFDIIIKNSDIIITQPISSNYRNLEYLSSEYIINNCNPSCKIIMFDSCYFNFYYFDLTYKTVNNNLIINPTDYHYNGLIDCYTNGLSREYYITHFVNNLSLKTNEELIKHATKSLAELRQRHYNTIKTYSKHSNISFISCVDFIENNYKEKLLFYSMNHPTKYVIQNISAQIIAMLNIPNTMLYDLDVLNNVKCIIYKCIQNVVNFNIEDLTPCISHVINTTNVVSLYYDTYNELKITF